MAKCTFGTGSFLLLNLGNLKPTVSTVIDNIKRGLITTIAYHINLSDPVYATEGAVAAAGSALKYIESIGVAQSVVQISTFADSVDNSSNVYFVPAFAGLLAPYWRSDARAALLGLHFGASRAHICRSVLESIAFQTHDILESISVSMLRVDGKLTCSDVLMQVLSNITGRIVYRLKDAESTAKGAAIMAGIGVNLLSMPVKWGQITDEFYPLISNNQREVMLRGWKSAVNSVLAHSINN